MEPTNNPADPTKQPGTGGVSTPATGTDVPQGGPTIDQPVPGGNPVGTPPAVPAEEPVEPVDQPLSTPGSSVPGAPKPDEGTPPAQPAM